MKQHLSPTTLLIASVLPAMLWLFAIAPQVHAQATQDELAPVVDRAATAHGSISPASPEDVDVALGSGPVIDIWYGSHQVFGQHGVPQRWVNILGNVPDVDDVASLVYSLNAGTPVPLSTGPDEKRLVGKGNFNVDLPYTDLMGGPNEVVITATNSLGETAVSTVTVEYVAGEVWPNPYSIDWSSVARIQDVAQVVDGLWTLQAEGIRTVNTGYDRLVAIADVSWDDYEVTVPVTIHSAAVFGGVGILMRWKGHTDALFPGWQPKTGWLPMGGLGWCKWRSDGQSMRLELRGNDHIIAVDTSGRKLELGVRYIFKMRVETNPDHPGLGGFYALKVWKEGQAEPEGWDLAGQDSVWGLQNGSFLLLAHLVDASFGDVTVTPVYPHHVDASLLAGLNLLAPNVQTEPPTSAETALDEIADQEGDASAVYRWLTESDTWQGHDRGKPYNNFALELGQGYFFKAAEASTWTRSGQRPTAPVPVEVRPSWTLMGLPTLPEPMTAGDLLIDTNAQEGECTEVYRWDTPSGWWQGHAGLPGTEFDLTDHDGYFLKCAQQITYVPGLGLAQRLPSSWQAPVEPEVLEPQADPSIHDVVVTNLRDVAFSVTWRTDRPSTGWLEYGVTPGLGIGRLGNSGIGDLGGGRLAFGTGADGLLASGDLPAASRVHQVTLTGLSPETTYYFRVHSGGTVDDNAAAVVAGGALYQVTTKATALPSMPFLAYGQVLTAGGALETGVPAVGALVRAWVVETEERCNAPGRGVAPDAPEPLSAVVDGWGYWSLNLPLAECSGVQVRLEVAGHDGGQAMVILPACAVRPVATVVLAGEGAKAVYLPVVLRGRR